MSATRIAELQRELRITIAEGGDVTGISAELDRLTACNVCSTPDHATEQNPADVDDWTDPEEGVDHWTSDGTHVDPWALPGRDPVADTLAVHDAHVPAGEFAYCDDEACPYYVTPDRRAVAHQCPNCAPGYDCARGIYAPAADDAPRGLTIPLAGPVRNPLDAFRQLPDLPRLVRPAPIADPAIAGPDQAAIGTYGTTGARWIIERIGGQTTLYLPDACAGAGRTVEFMPRPVVEAEHVFAVLVDGFTAARDGDAR